MFRFADPYVFLLLALIPLLVWIRRRRVRPAMADPNVDLAADVAPSPLLAIHRLIPLLYYLALVLLVMALARPQWGTQRTPVDTQGINIILTLDLSESMAALDFHQQGQTVNRLEAVKSVVRDFIAQRSGDRIGMVVFGSQAYTQLPLTRDYQAIEDILNRLQIGAAGRSTAIGDAIGISLKRLSDVHSRSNVIILLTDGRSNSGELEPDIAADLARQKGVKIYTIGVGSKGQVPILVHHPIFGDQYIYQEVDLDETTLRTIAEKTQGLYFRAQDMDGLRRIYQKIDSMEKTTVKAVSFAEYNDLYSPFIIAAFILLSVWIILKNTRFLSIP